MNSRVGLLVDERLLLHAIAGRTPENPERMRSLLAKVRQNFAGRCHFYEARRALPLEIEAVHSRFYLEQLHEHQGRPDPFSYDRDTYLMDRSLEVAELAAGGCLELADRIMAGEVEQGMALVRPPGHHAEPGRGMGFCILNNIAIVAEHLRRRHGLTRILVIDIDAHHGNGTQEAFYESDEVLFISLHQRDLFPFTGAAEEIGSGRGQGFNINVPVHAQFGDPEYSFLLGRILQGVVEQYLPQIILVSAGYDAHRDETISGTTLSTSWYEKATALLKQHARDCCDGRLLLILEGGYNPAALEDSVEATIEALLRERRSRIGVLFSERAHQLLKNHPLHLHWSLD